MITNWFLEQWNEINREIARLTKNPHISLALREEILKSQIKVKREYDLIQNQISKKQEELRTLKVTYKLLWIHPYNWWDAKKEELNQQITDAAWKNEYTELETDSLYYMIDRNRVRLTIHKFYI